MRKNCVEIVKFQKKNINHFLIIFKIDFFWKFKHFKISTKKWTKNIIEKHIICVFSISIQKFPGIQKSYLEYRADIFKEVKKQKSFFLSPSAQKIIRTKKARPIFSGQCSKISLVGEFGDSHHPKISNN